jgi:Na+/glutamate symporter
LEKPVDNQKQEVARQSIEKHEQSTRKAEEVRKTNNILSKRRMLKITENRRSKIKDMSNATAYINLFIAIARKIENLDD